MFKILGCVVYAWLTTPLLSVCTTSFPGPSVRTPVRRPYFSTDPRLNCGRFDTSGCIQDRLNFFRAGNLAAHEVTDWLSRRNAVGGLIRCDLWLCSRRGRQFPHDDAMEIRFTVLCVAKTSTTNLLTRRNKTRRPVPVVAGRCILWNTLCKHAEQMTSDHSFTRKNCINSLNFAPPSTAASHC